MADHHHASDYAAPAVDIDTSGLRRVAFLSAIVGFAAWAVMGAINLAAYGENQAGGVRDFFLTYLVGFVFWVSLPIGGMALFLLGYMTSASWGLVFRRLFQSYQRTLPLFAVLFIPVAVSLFMGLESPFWWINDVTDLEWAKDNAAVVKEVVHRKDIYLNWMRFLVTATVVFGIYYAINSYINKWAYKAEDDGDEVAYGKLRYIAGPGFIVWALTFTVIITDWVMSIEPTWSSTMFPVIAAMNCFLTTFAFSAFILYTLIGSNEPVLSIIKNKFRIDIGSLMLGFTMVWSYATFSQYMLIFAGNMPEEIGYVLRRTTGGWEWMAYLLLAVHWALPFLILLFREVKTDPTRMRWLTRMLLFICMVDVCWWIVPTYPHANGFLHVPMAFAAIAGVGGVFGLVFLGQLSKRNLLAKKQTEFLATWGEHH